MRRIDNEPNQSHKITALVEMYTYGLQWIINVKLF